MPRGRKVSPEQISATLGQIEGPLATDMSLALACKLAQRAGAEPGDLEVAQRHPPVRPVCLIRVSVHHGSGDMLHSIHKRAARNADVRSLGTENTFRPVHVPGVLAPSLLRVRPRGGA